MFNRVVALRRSAFPDAYLVVASSLVLFEDRVAAEVGVVRGLDVDLAAEGAEHAGVYVGEQPDADVIDVGKLIARGIHYRVVRVAGRKDAVHVIGAGVDPRSELREFRILDEAGGMGSTRAATEQQSIDQVLPRRVGTVVGMELFVVVLGMHHLVDRDERVHARVGRVAGYT